eukprot:CAMPEP_0204916924 /NCGR_PEP_ID=MMETSP1397-20131031/14633_1 /ASSEMBLY_ACC=CAM_ASM_000891 /TAXON_ID=49980 /ORGANISM="Climacostomum Climacostomum virens, Strain Stock W-24" /LENGTH=315 /DNA_ID=CAMNT_0052089609 /DNA_START=188 /DNA_END=1135 /DNA_ORIENTATION=+
MGLDYDITYAFPHGIDLTPIKKRDTLWVEINDSSLDFSVNFEPSKLSAMLIGLWTPASCMITGLTIGDEVVLLCDDFIDLNGESIYNVRRSIPQELRGLEFVSCHVELKSYQERDYLRFGHLVLVPDRCIESSKKRSSFYNPEKAEVNRLNRQKQIDSFITTQKDAKLSRDSNSTEQSKKQSNAKTVGAQTSPQQPLKQSCLDIDALLAASTWESNQRSLLETSHTYSYLLEGYTVFLSLTDALTEYQISRICRECGGIVAESLTEDITHVITDLMDDIVLTEARRLRVKVMLLDWIFQSFRMKELAAEDIYLID